MKDLSEVYKFESGKVNNYLHLVDIHQFKKERVFSVFIAEFNDYSLILDCGTSFDINRLLRYMKKNEISLKSVKYIIPSHHHFDHSGGLWKLYNKIREANSEIKILCNSLFSEKINNFEIDSHFIYSRKSFGGLMGELRKIEPVAFKIIKEEDYFNDENQNAIESFKLNNHEVKLCILKTPGHSPDHICPMFIINDQLDFIYFGDALGIRNNIYKLVTAPTVSAPNFTFNDYMNSVDELRELNPLSAGFSHAGYIFGVNHIKNLMDEHKTMMIQFRKMVIKYYKENQETKYVFEKIWPWLKTKTDVGKDYTDNAMIRKLCLSMVYGMMVDLGYRKI